MFHARDCFTVFMSHQTNVVSLYFDVSTNIFMCVTYNVYLFMLELFRFVGMFELREHFFLYRMVTDALPILIPSSPGNFAQQVS